MRAPTHYSQSYKERVKWIVKFKIYSQKSALKLRDALRPRDRPKRDVLRPRDRPKRDALKQNVKQMS